MRKFNEKFETYFSSVYGDRWPNLFKALENKETQVLRKNIFADYEAKDFLAANFPFCFQVNSEISTHNLTDKNEIQVFYKMDPASVLVAMALDVQPEDLVLDLCAAPGGKTLILAEKLNGTGQLVANEYSNARRERLLRVVREYLPYQVRQNVFVQGKDGNQFGQQKADIFDRVLVDAPCSGERHLLENPKEFADWTKRRSENLAIRQYSLLSSAYLACRSRGQIVYSTCSISPLENDDVVRKLNKKRSVEFLNFSEACHYPFLEKTEFGYQILPDRANGYGPMYFSIIRKLAT